MSLTPENLRTSVWHQTGRGPRYRQLSQHLARMIHHGALEKGTSLPAERHLAELAGVSRVTVRKAMADLAASGLVVSRAGAGSFVTGTQPRFAQSLSRLASFSDTLLAQGMRPESRVLNSGYVAASMPERSALGLAIGTRVLRIDRLRLGDGVPVAVESAALPVDLLPDPKALTPSLYDALQAAGHGPVRAVQRVSAAVATPGIAANLSLPEGTALLRIERTGFDATGRVVEFTTGHYRSDICDFVSDLRSAEP